MHKPNSEELGLSESMRVKADDLNMQYILECLQRSEQIGNLKLGRISDSIWSIQTREYEERVNVQLKHLSINGISYNFLDGRAVNNKAAGAVYRSSAYEFGERDLLPNVVQMQSTLASGTYEGIRSNDFLVLELSGTEYIDSIYVINKPVAHQLILNRILNGDSLIEYAVSENTVYAKFVNEANNPYIIWYAGELLFTGTLEAQEV
jgi:hypothetical protein